MDRVADAAKKIVRPACPGMLGQRLVISNSHTLARSDGGRGSPQEVTSDRCIWKWVSQLLPEASASGQLRRWAADMCTGSGGRPGVGGGAAAGRSARDRCTSKRMSQLSPEVVAAGWRRRR